LLDTFFVSFLVPWTICMQTVSY